MTPRIRPPSLVVWSLFCWALSSCTSLLGNDFSIAADDAGAAGGAGLPQEGGPSSGGGECAVGQVEPCYEGPAATEGVGPCRRGARTCDATTRTFGACEGQTLPAPAEDCTRAGDENCDGSESDGCPCAPVGAEQPCNQHAGLDGVGLCRAGAQLCETTGWSACAGGVAPAARDCSSPADGDCNGTPDNAIDAACQCAVGSSRPCDEHPGLDGVGPCRAGSQSCAAGTPPSTSAYGTCGGAVGPAADDCEADGADLDCNRVRGDGRDCFKNLYVYGSAPAYSCQLAPADRPLLFLADQDDPAGVPAGFALITQFKIFRAGGGSKTAIFRCFNAADNFFFTGYSGCGGGSVEQRLLGYVSNVNGGEGWVALAEFFGKNFGPTGTMRSDDPLCCPGNCNLQQRFVLK
jgi:hypothetical protein